MGSVTQLKGITRRFPGIIVDDYISIDIEEGEVRTLVGESGADKSTLMNILYGLYQPNKSEFLIRGEPVHLTSSGDSIRHKIGMVRQYFIPVPKLTVTEDIIVGQEVSTALKVGRARANQKIKALPEQYGLKIDPDRKVNKLSVTEQQGVEILKILYQGVEILIFDEPMTVLTPQETEEFCGVLLKLKEKGKTIIFISHKLAEVAKISDKIAAVHLGRVVSTVGKNETDLKGLTKTMVGRDINLGRRERKQAEKIKSILEAKDVSYAVDKTVKKLNHINLELKKGEVLDIADVDGNGQEELVNAIHGKVRPDSSSVIMNGQDITYEKIRTRKDSGLGLIPKDRHRDDLVLEYSIANNLTLDCQYQKPHAKKNVWFGFKKIHEAAETLKERFGIRCINVDVSTGTLPGDNQQKIIIIREAYRNPDMLVAVQPTRGLDVGAMEFVQEMLLEQRDQGKGVLLFSLELDEILSVSDRTAVIFKGEIIDIVDAGSVTR